jgi:hypothetical protein
MLAHGQGSLLNASRLSASLAISAQTVTRYIDLLADLMLVRRLPPFLANIGKRLVKSPKVYVRDSGLLHALLGIIDFDQLSGRPVVGTSWKGFAIKNLISAAPAHSSASFYRTSAGAEIDLLLDIPEHGRWAIELKRGRAPRIEPSAPPEGSRFLLVEVLGLQRHVGFVDGNEFREWRFPLVPLDDMDLTRCARCLFASRYAAIGAGFVTTAPSMIT